MKSFYFKKSLGQNFLNNTQAAKRIVDLANITQDDDIIEIGCGNGALTKEILDKNPRSFTIFEIDKRCIDIVNSNLALHENFGKIIMKNENALNIDISKLSLVSKPSIISNLPYSVGCRIFVNLLLQNHDIKKMILMFQKEVAKRIISPPKTKNYGLLSIISQLSSKPCIKFDLNPGNFIPSPKVQSSIMTFDLLNFPSNELKTVLDQGKTLFSKRRKMIKRIKPEIKNSFLKKYAQNRVEELNPNEILELCKWACTLEI